MEGTAPRGIVRHIRQNESKEACEDREQLMGSESEGLEVEEW